MRTETLGAICYSIGTCQLGTLSGRSQGVLSLTLGQAVVILGHMIALLMLAKNN